MHSYILKVRVVPVWVSLLRRVSLIKTRDLYSLLRWEEGLGHIFNHAASRRVIEGSLV